VVQNFEQLGRVVRMGTIIKRQGDHFELNYQPKGNWERWVEEWYSMGKNGPVASLFGNSPLIGVSNS